MGAFFLLVNFDPVRNGTGPVLANFENCYERVKFDIPSKEIYYNIKDECIMDRSVAFIFLIRHELSESKQKYRDTLPTTSALFLLSLSSRQRTLFVFLPSKVCSFYLNCEAEQLFQSQFRGQSWILYQ